MAELGISQLNAVNLVLAGIGEERVSAIVAETASDIAGAALYQLNRSQEMVLAEGWRDNTDICRPITPTGSGPYIVTLDSDVLAVRGSGPHHYRNFGIRAGLLWDSDAHTSSFSSNSPIYLDIVRNAAWADLSPRLKHIVVNHATLVFQRRRRGSPVADQQLLQEVVQSAATADLRGPRMDGEPINRYPMFTRVPAGQVQGGQGQ